MADKIIARKDAMAQGLKRYFTGKPCRKRSHCAERLCSNGKCLACVKLENPARSRRRYAANPKKTLDRSRRWAKLNPAKVKAKSVRWREANPEKWRESNRISKRANQQKYTDRQRADYALNPEKYRTVERKRRAQMAGSGGIHTADDLATIFSNQNGRCVYCRSDLTKTDRHVDHIMPLALGGSNGPENLQYLCRPCNQSKGAQHPNDFARKRALLL